MDQHLTDSNSPNNIQPSISTLSSSNHRSILAIDLNQIPSPSETLILSPTSLVRSFHDIPTLPDAPAAEIPSADLVCAGCGDDGESSDRLVCDGCERGFHFVCSGSSGELLEEWLCKDCLIDGVLSRRWRLGRTKEDIGFRFLDINVAPPIDGADAVSNAAHSRTDCFHDNACASGGVLPYPNSMYSGNGFGFQKALSIVKHTARLDIQDVLTNSWSVGRSFENVGHVSQLGRIRGSNTAFRLPYLNPGEVLQSLREFVSERHGVLEEGWRVEFRQSKNGHETFAVYCAPNGKVFETMSDVAIYLGLASSNNTMEPDLRNEDGSALRRIGLHLPKRRKITKLPIANGYMENTNNLVGRLNNGFPSHSENGHFSASKRERNSVVIQEEVSDTLQVHEGLPLQYDDFFVLSLGKIDTRASYHDSCQISPVGYRSCWHDKITGSLFVCHVLDGGDSGPIFEVKRFSCSALPVPYGSTILQRSRVQSNVPKKEDKLTTSDEQCCIEMILSQPCSPVEGDSLSWLLSKPSEVDDQTTNHSKFESHCVGEEIGEFSVDGNSSSSVWSSLSLKLADACRQIFKQTGSLNLFCKHANEGISSYYDIINEKNEDLYASLHKFCSLLGSLKMPSVVKSDDDLCSTIDALQCWLDSDRFGLDVDFVQELIEQCSDVKHCSRYESLNWRNGHLKAPLVHNGLLLINGKSIEQCQQDSVIDSLYKRYRKSQESAKVIHSRPPGKLFGEKLPPYLVGDVLQVWGLIFRFGEILSLEPMKFHELETELLSPWFENLYLLRSCEESFCGEHTSSSSGEIGLPEESRHVELEMTDVMKDTRAKINPSTHSKCTGLRRAHMSLLDVIVSELQIKVAAMVDPSIDGESKSKRGRRKDVDSSILAIKRKLNLLPINELTWPELARRYILAVLSMDGNLDSAETGMRECGKVFRCLQGDGGVLCGSLVGVAGIEADALLLAEATKRIYGCLISESHSDYLTIEDDDPEPVSDSGITGGGNGNIPAWAQVLEPVRKLPTNVGTRIRKCVYEALEKDPPDWARKRLQQSISKVVYKGNASGPTKKAVLSVLQDAHLEATQQKIAKDRKKKMIISIADIVMMRCRILLRRAASADKEKMFCNLLGRNLLSTENDDEGLLGTPAMVSRPLDFRTIDLRLAVGVYNGSHEAFLEDVRELWNNIRIAHADQPELVQLAETLSKNFESLYLDEVAVLVGKLKEYSKMEEISPETKKEMLDVVVSTNDIPKAPWDEGVCKVCGVDKDDVSVLLCDTCDAEYHTYCLNPPLARIPEGNWYCPSCVSGISLLAGTSKGAPFNGRKHRTYHGDGIRNYLEDLTRLNAVLLQKDYWELSVDERILLLKFLCDEVLNSIVIRQHMEQCFETSADLQQKLRILYSEWKIMKLQEDKLTPDISNLAGHSSMETNVGTMANQLDKNVSCNTQIKQPMELEPQVEDFGQMAKEDSVVENHDFSGKDGESSSQRQIHERAELDVSDVCKSEDSVSASCGLLNGGATENTCSTSVELKAVQKELSILQQSIARVEAQLLKSSTRMEFLGTDSSGRLYWAFAQQGTHPWVIVDGTMALKPRKQGMAHISYGGSSSVCPFVYGSSCSYPTCSQWVYYQSEAEVRELVMSLNDYDPKERELKDSIRHSQKLRLDELHQPGKQVQVLHEESKSNRTEGPNLLATKAFNALECKYGRSSLRETTEVKKRLKISKGTDDEKLYRCKCLEPVWSSRHHCFSCHRTFYAAEELRGHSDEKCCSSSPVSGKAKANVEPSGIPCGIESDTRGIESDKQQHLVVASEKAQTPKSAGSKLSRLVELQNKDLPCPYGLEEIISKFVTNDSIKELVSEIGLIGSEGEPSFIPSVSSYLNDPTLMFKEGRVSHIDPIPIPEKTDVKVCTNSGADISDHRLSRNKHGSSGGQRIPRIMENRKKFSPSNFTSPMVVEAYCTVPESSLKAVGESAIHILKQLKICLLDMEAALPEGSVRLLKADFIKRRAWHDFVKSAGTIFEMVQASIVLEDMIKTDYLKNEWWYWSSLSAAIQTSTLSALALRIFALDNAIIYDRTVSDLTRVVSLKSIDDLDQLSLSTTDSSDKSKQARRSSRRKRDADG